MEQTERKIITLQQENGKEQDYLLIMVFALQENMYAGLVPAGDDGEPLPADLALYGYDETGDDDFNIYEIEDEEEYEIARKAFEASLKHIAEA